LWLTAETPETLDDAEKTFQNADDEDLEEIIERRATSFRLVDRIGVIQEKLETLQKLYSPLYAISQLRFPSPVGRGGHDFFDNGRITNRSESFRDHRSHLLFVARIYDQLLKSTEEQAWYSIQESVGIPGQFRKIVGTPVVIRFQEPGLNHEVFNQWIAATFERKQNRFRLWGHPLRLGPTKVHVYGVDRHLWQPLFLELTAKGCLSIIPNGTCGNTVHRLVTNIQRYLDPGAEAFSGSGRWHDSPLPGTSGSGGGASLSGDRNGVRSGTLPDRPAPLVPTRVPPPRRSCRRHAISDDEGPVPQPLRRGVQ
jgi:hypothetical protein